MDFALFNQLTTCTKGAPSSWQWQGKAEDSLYCALYPRAWTVYNLPKVELGAMRKKKDVLSKLFTSLQLTASQFKVTLLMRDAAS